jgi:hypothetical protein
MWFDEKINDLSVKEAQCPLDYQGVASDSEAMTTVRVYGCPAYLNLGEGKVMPFLKWLREKYPNSPPAFVVRCQDSGIGEFMMDWKKSVT